MAEMTSPREPLATRMKSYEAATDTRLPPNTPAVLRLDGHGFSKFTAHFNRPFDQRIHDAMVNTCADLLRHFPNATMAYTQSDEITLVFPSSVDAFNDRIQKIATLAASFTSVTFNAHLSAAVEKCPEPLLKKAETVMGTAYFDARLFGVPTVEDALNCVLWRCKGDAVRNGVFAFARSLYSTKELHGKSTQEVLDMMEKEKGVVFKGAVPSWVVEGTIVKKEQFEGEGRNEKTGEIEKTMRTRTKAVDRGVVEFSEANMRLVTEKFWS